MIGNLLLSDPIYTSEGLTKSQIVERVGMNVNHVEIFCNIKCTTHKL